MKLPVLLSFPLLITQSISAEELRMETPDAKVQVVMDLPKLKTTHKVERRDFYRGQKRIGSILTMTQLMRVDGQDKEPIVGESVQFYIDADNWVQVSLTDPSGWTVNGNQKLSVNSSRNEIYVYSKDSNYFEAFNVKKKTFAAAEEWEILKKANVSLMERRKAD